MIRIIKGNEDDEVATTEEGSSGGLRALRKERPTGRGEMEKGSEWARPAKREWS